MEKLNVVARLSETPRWDMMNAVSKMQIDLDRMYNDLQADATNAEMDALRGAITNLGYLKVQLNNNRSPNPEGVEV